MEKYNYIPKSCFADTSINQRLITRREERFNRFFATDLRNIISSLTKGSASGSKGNFECVSDEMLKNLVDKIYKSAIGLCLDTLDICIDQIKKLYTDDYIIKNLDDVLNKVSEFIKEEKDIIEREIRSIICGESQEESN